MKRFILVCLMVPACGGVEPIPDYTRNQSACMARALDDAKAREASCRYAVSGPCRKKNLDKVTEKEKKRCLQ
jgi:hypothetical protein